MRLWACSALAKGQRFSPITARSSQRRVSRTIRSISCGAMEASMPDRATDPLRDQLGVESQQVVPVETDSGDRRLTCQAGVRSMPVVAMQPARQLVGALC